MRAEWRNTGLVLITNDQQSFWSHAKQQDGSILTQFHLQFHATNTSERGLVYLSKVRLNRPWVSRDRILTSILMTEHPTHSTDSIDYGIPARRRGACTADILALDTIGGVGKKKPMASASACKIISADGISWCFAGALMLA
jgi:hypothetical protein